MARSLVDDVGALIISNSFAMRSTFLHWIRSTWIAVAAGLAVLEVLPAAGAPSAQFLEMYDLIRTHLPGVDDASLERAAITGLLSQFSGRVSLVGAPAASGTTPDPKSLLQLRSVEDRFAYLRVPRLDGVSGPLKGALAEFLSTNQVKGGVLDLRFSQGKDFASAAGVAMLFVSSNKALLDWGEGMKRAESEMAAPRVPWVVLVNGETMGSPEALAATLRQTETALLVGSKTAGQAATSKEYPLRNGDRLLIASEPVKTGDGNVIPPQGLVPDIEVKVELDFERAAWNDDFKTLSARAKDSAGKRASAESTSRATRRRVNEAELVRMQKEGKRTDLEVTPAAPETAATASAEAGSLVSDPVLSRALDLLKGLAVVRRASGS